MMSSLHLILATLSTKRHHPVDTIDAGIDNIRAHIDDEPTLPICWHSLADSLSITLDRFRRQFKKRVGRSPTPITLMPK